MRHIKNITILALFSIILCLTISSCRESGSSNKKSYTTQQVDEVNNKVVENQTAKTKAEIKSVKYSSNNSNIFVFMSLILNLLCVCLLSYVIMVRSGRHGKDIGELESNSLDHGNREALYNGLTPRDVSQLISKHLSEEKNLAIIVDYIKQSEKFYERKEISEVVRPTVQQVQSIPEVMEIKLYAGSPEGDTFHKTYDSLNDNITYEMIINCDNIAEFKVHPSAINKILTDQSFLETACDMQMPRYREWVSLVMIENGIAEKQPSGKWKITKKAKVKFE